MCSNCSFRFSVSNWRTCLIYSQDGRLFLQFPFAGRIERSHKRDTGTGIIPHWNGFSNRWSKLRYLAVVEARINSSRSNEEKNNKTFTDRESPAAKAVLWFYILNLDKKENEIINLTFCSCVLYCKVGIYFYVWYSCTFQSIGYNVVYLKKGKSKKKIQKK